MESFFEQNTKKEKKKKEKVKQSKKWNEFVILTSLKHLKAIGNIVCVGIWDKRQYLEQ